MMHFYRKARGLYFLVFTVNVWATGLTAPLALKYICVKGETFQLKSEHKLFF